jgi:hypothetical protein
VGVRKVVDLLDRQLHDLLHELERVDRYRRGDPGPARMSRPATSGMAAIRLELATVRAAAEIRRALRMETSSGGAAGAGA